MNFYEIWGKVDYRPGKSWWDLEVIIRTIFRIFYFYLIYIQYGSRLIWKVKVKLGKTSYSAVRGCTCCARVTTMCRLHWHRRCLHTTEFRLCVLCLLQQYLCPRCRPNKLWKINFKNVYKRVFFHLNIKTFINVGNKRSAVLSRKT